MSDQPQRDWLEDALRDNASYINDAGFTARVVATLPKQRKPAWLRSAVLVSTAAIGCVIGLFVLPGAKFATDSIVQLLTARSLSPTLLAPAVFILAMLGAAFAALASEK